MVEAAAREKRELAMQEKIVLLRKREMVASAVMSGDKVRQICERHGIVTDGCNVAELRKKLVEAMPAGLPDPSWLEGGGAAGEKGLRGGKGRKRRRGDGNGGARV